MDFIKQLLSKTDLLKGQSPPYSIACISTSRPIYLVFDKMSDFPLYVIRKLDNPSAIHSHTIHIKLYATAGNLVPEPIGVYDYAGVKYDVQRGVKGIPWFQLKSKIGAGDKRTNLEKKMWQTLEDFQTAIRSDATKATQKLRPQEELRRAYSSYVDTGDQVNPKLEKLVEQAANDLSLSSSCPSIPQHGDFCLNNLIFDIEKITVID